MTGSSSWSSWLGVGHVSEEAKVAKAAAKEQKHDAAVVALRAMLQSEEGRLCGRQLAQGAPSSDG